MVSVNLIPQDVQLDQMWRRHIRSWILLIVLAGGLLAAPLTIEWAQRAEASELRSLSEKLNADRAKNRRELNKLTSEASDLLLKLERANALRAKRTWSAIFATIDERMPDTCWLTSGATDPAAPPSARVRRNVVRDRSPAEGEDPGVVVIEAPRKLRIAGHATNASEPHEFVTSLKQSGVFTAVALERFRLEPVLNGSYFRFELVCEW